MRFLFIIRIRLPRRGWKCLQVNMYGAANAARKRSAEQTTQQGDQSDANQGNTAASHELFHPQLGVKLCSMAGGGVQKIYMVFFKRTVPAGQVRQ